MKYKNIVFLIIIFSFILSMNYKSTTIISSYSIKYVEKEETDDIEETNDVEAVEEVEEKIEENTEVVDNNEPENNGSIDIKSLIIKGYDIDFKTDKTDYDLTINEDVKSLEFDIVLEDDTSKYEIIGNDNLNNYVNKIIINVTSLDNKEKKYTINVIKESINDKSVDNNEIDSEVVKNVNNFMVNKKYIIIALGSLTVILVIALGIFMKRK